MHPLLRSLLALPLLAPPLGAQSASVYETHEVDVPPRATNPQALTEALRAGYPTAAVDSAFEGLVWVSLVVDTNGDPQEVRVVEAALPAFDSASVAAARVLRFTPGVVDGRPVPVRVQFPVRWMFVEGEAPAPDEPPAPEERELTGLVETTPTLVDPEGFTRLLLQEYPPLLRDAGVSGEVRVRFVVDQNGRATEVVVLHSTHVEFVGPTRRVLGRVRFVPATVQGLPVRARVELPITWSSPWPGRTQFTP
jgi:TonB family protein